MMKQLPYELGKVWMKRSFRALMAVLLACNVFLLWYLNVPGEDEPPLGAYRAVASDISAMSEGEKLAYISELKECVDGVLLVNDVRNLQAQGDEMSMLLAACLRQENPGAFEKYQDIYEEGDYLVYTDSLHRESALLNELYSEITTVSGYEEYLAGVRQRREDLSGISIFAASESESFSSRNIEKSAADHAGLSSENIRWYPSRGIRMADGNRVTELLMLLSVFLFVGNLITEEKEKGLFYITKSTRLGRASSIGAKLLALLVHCMAVSVLMYGSNLLFVQITAGLGDLSASLQSVPAFLESSLPVSLMEYILLGMLTKGLVLFSFGAALSAVSIASDRYYVPQLTGVLWLMLNWLCFTWIPAYSLYAPVKYLSLFGLLKPEILYGGYLNFSVGEIPAARLTMALWVIFALCAAGCGLCFLLFCRCGSLGMRRVRILQRVPFRPHAGIGRYEGYKIFLMGRAVLVLLLFAVLIGFQDLGRSYSPSVREQYYRDIMLKLEGELSEEKEDLISMEQARFEEAFEQIERIDRMVASGAVGEAEGEDMKSRWVSIVSFYPSFERVLRQREHIGQAGGVFLYDTGYAYLFGTMDESFLTDFLLLTLCMVFAFGNAMAVEYQNNSWHILSATVTGKKNIIKKKILSCACGAMGMAALPWFFRIAAISRQYPLHGWADVVQNLPQYFGLGVRLPIWLFFLFAVLCQMLAVTAVAGVVFMLSWWRRSYIQAVCFSFLLLVVPLVLAVMGLG